MSCFYYVFSFASVLSYKDGNLKKSYFIFQVENLFCLGSPLAVFLALRGVPLHGCDSSGQPNIIPPEFCRRLFNIYHPADPIVSRIFSFYLVTYENSHAKYYPKIVLISVHLRGREEIFPFFFPLVNFNFIQMIHLLINQMEICFQLIFLISDTTGSNSEMSFFFK